MTNRDDAFRASIAAAAASDDVRGEDEGLVEVMARAICAAEGIDPDKRVISLPTIFMMTMDAEWNDSADVGAEWEEWKPHAIAALDALRRHGEG